MKKEQQGGGGVVKCITILGIKFKFSQPQKLILEKIDRLLSKNKTLENNQRLILAKTNDTRKLLLEKIDKKSELIVKKLNDVNSRLDSYFTVCISDYEKQRCKEIYEDMQKIDFKEKYQNLIKNLDIESVNTISKIFARIIKIATGNSNIFKGFSQEELDAIKEIKGCFSHEILKLSNDCYCLKNYYLPVNHFEASVFAYKHGIDNLNKEHFKNKNIIDAGGFIGDSAIVLSDYTNKNVYSFEPESENYDLLLKTIKLNSKNNIIPVNCGLGAADCELEINADAAASSIVRQVHSGLKKETIKITTLDKYVLENNLDVGLIKVDIEGFEQEFLKGALYTIKKQRPILLLSIYHNLDDYLNIKPFIEALDLGYNFKIVRPDDGGIRGETLLICQTGILN